MTDNTQESVVLKFANGIEVTIDQCSDTRAPATTGVVVRAGDGEVKSLSDLRGDSTFYNPQGSHGFLLTKEKE